MTSFAVPIRDNAGNVVGVAGVDLTLTALGELNFTKGDYESTGFALLSNQGRYMVSPVEDQIGKNLTDVSLERVRPR
jgi:hypothetical protein